MRFDSAFNPAGDVGIFNTDDEAAAVAPGKEPGKESGPHVADMRGAGGAGSKTSSDGFCHKILLASNPDISQHGLFTGYADNVGVSHLVVEALFILVKGDPEVADEGE